MPSNLEIGANLNIPAPEARKPSRMSRRSCRYRTNQVQIRSDLAVCDPLRKGVHSTKTSLCLPLQPQRRSQSVEGTGLKRSEDKEAQEHRQDLLDWLEKVDLTPGGHKRRDLNIRSPKIPVASSDSSPEGETIHSHFLDAAQAHTINRRPRVPAVSRSRPARRPHALGSLWNPMPSLWQGGMPHQPAQHYPAPPCATVLAAPRGHGRANSNAARYSFPERAE